MHVQTPSQQTGSGFESHSGLPAVCIFSRQLGFQSKKMKTRLSVPVSCPGWIPPAPPTPHPGTVVSSSSKRTQMQTWARCGISWAGVIFRDAGVAPVLLSGVKCGCASFHAASPAAAAAAAAAGRYGSVLKVNL